MTERIAYFKNGDVVDQLDRIRRLDGERPAGGPDAFLASLLGALGRRPALMISWHESRRVASADFYAGHTLRVRKRAGLVVRLRDHAAAAAETLYRLAAFKPHAVLCGSLGLPLWLCCLFARLRGVPVVFSLHNQLRLPLRQSPLKRARVALDAFAIRRCDAALCHGPFLKSELLAIGAKAERVIEFDCGVRDTVAAAVASGAGDRIAQADAGRGVLYVGRIIAAKGVFDLLAACRPLLASHGDLRLDYVGDGPDLPGLREEVRRLGLEDRVAFHGHLPHGRIGVVMRGAWAVVTPTRLALGEARCMTAMEALGLGVPVVAPSLGAFPFLVRHGENGMLYEPDKVDALGACLRRLLDEPSTHAAIKQGAALSGQALLDPPLTFGAAVSRALRLSGAEPASVPAASCANPRGERG